MDKLDLILERLGKFEEDMNSRLDAVDSRLDGLELEITKTNLTIENEIKPQIGILAEAVQGINAKLDAMPTAEDLEITNSRIDTLEAIVKRLSRDVANLKKAQ